MEERALAGLEIIRDAYEGSAADDVARQVEDLTDLLSRLKDEFRVVVSRLQDALMSAAAANADVAVADADADAADDGDP